MSGFGRECKTDVEGDSVGECRRFELIHIPLAQRVEPFLSIRGFTNPGQFEHDPLVNSACPTFFAVPPEVELV